MKSLSKFVRDTITGGVMLILPLTFLFLIVDKAVSMLLKVTKPLAAHLPDYGYGLDGNRLLAVLMLVVICFLAGLLFRSKMLRNWIDKAEAGVLSSVPGYTFIMSTISDLTDKDSEDTMQSVLVASGDQWTFGFQMEERDGLCTVFFPGSPNYKSGSVKVMPTASVRKINVNSHDIAKNLKQMGKDSIQFVKLP